VQGKAKPASETYVYNPQNDPQSERTERKVATPTLSTPTTHASQEQATRGRSLCLNSKQNTHSGRGHTIHTYIREKKTKKQTKTGWRVKKKERFRHYFMYDVID